MDKIKVKVLVEQVCKLDEDEMKYFQELMEESARRMIDQGLKQLHKQGKDFTWRDGELFLAEKKLSEEEKKLVEKAVKIGAGYI